MVDANHRPFHPAFGVSSYFNASIYLGTRPTKQQFNEDTGKNETLEYEGIYEKRTFFRHFGRKLNQSDLTNTEIFNEDRLELIKWFLRWQTEGIKAYNGGFRTKEEYQKTLQSPNS